MSKLVHAVKRASSDFHQHKIPFALVGGLAVSVRTEPRFTRDADFAVAVSGDREAEAIARLFLSLKYRVVSTVEQDAQNRLATIRLSVADEDAQGIVIDLLFASSGIEKEIVAEAELLEVFGSVILPVCTTGLLIALKVLSHDEIKRPQDGVDIQKLIRVADETELNRARLAAALIMERGFNRERDLIGDLERFIVKMTDM